MQQKRLNGFRHLRRSEFKFSMMCQNTVHHQCFQLFRKALYACRRIPHQLRAHKNVPQKLPFIGIIVLREVRKLHHLGNIMQHSARDEDIPVYEFISRSQEIAGFGHRKRMLYQPAAKAVVHIFCRRVVLKFFGNDRMTQKNLLQQLFDVLVGYCFYVTHQRVVHFVNIFFSARHKICGVIFAIVAAADAFHVQLQIIVKCGDKCVYLDKITLREALDILCHIPDLGIDHAGFILQFQGEVRLSVAGFHALARFAKVVFNNIFALAQFVDVFHECPPFYGARAPSARLYLIIHDFRRSRHIKMKRKRAYGLCALRCPFFFLHGYVICGMMEKTNDLKGDTCMQNVKKMIAVFAALAMLLSAAPVYAKTSEPLIVNNWHLDFRDRTKNCSNIDMGWEWNARSRTLTLKDFRVQVPNGEMEHQAAIFLPENSTIQLVGDDNAIYAHAYDCTPIYCEGKLTFAGRGSMLITTDSRAASGIFVEHGPLVFSESVEITFDPAGYVFTLNEVESGEAVLSMRDKAKVIFPDDHLRAIAVTHDSSVKSNQIAYDYDQNIDREAGSVTLLKNSAKSGTENLEELPEEQNALSHEYRFPVGSPVVLKDGSSAITVGASPYISSGYTMLPLRALESLSSPEQGTYFSTTWDSAARTISIRHTVPDHPYNPAVLIFIDEPKMRVEGGEFLSLTAPVALKDGRTFVSLRDFAKALELLGIDCEIHWESATKTAVLTILDAEA